MKEQFTISIFTENRIGLLNRVSIILTRRHINMESITASESEVRGIHRLTVVVNETREKVEKVVKQITKQVEVFGAFYHKLDEIIYREIALYKIPTSAVSNGLALEKLMLDYHANILSVDEEYIIIEKTGHKEETQQLLDELHPHGILEFVRSGRVAIMKQKENITDLLHELEKAHNFDD